MFCEDDEVVAETADAGEAVETDSVEVTSDEPVEAASDESAADEPATADETAADALEEVPSLFDWNGEVDSLREAEWVKKLDMSVRESVLRGVESKYRNFERGYTKAFQENALKRKALERREQEIKDTELRVQKWLHGDIDPMEEKQKEIEMMRQHHASALDTLHKEHEKALSKHQTGYAEELEKHIKAREAAESELSGYQTERQERKEAEMKAEVDNFENWIKEEAPHVYADQDALYALCVNVASGIPQEKALRMVLGAHPTPEPEEPPPAEPEKVPEAVEMMSMGASAAASTEPTNDQSLDERLDILRRQAMAEEYAALNSSS